MGGSAIGGGLARAILGDHASRPIAVARAYGLPPWATPDTTVLCASYSGNTEETLACYDAAGFVGARRVVVTSGGRLAEQARADGVPVIPIPGGFQPRAAVAYMTVAALEVAALCGVGPRMTSEVDVAAVAPRVARRASGARTAPTTRWPRRIARGDRSARSRSSPGAGLDRADRLPLEDASSTRTPSCRRSRTSCPSSTTTRSSGGRASTSLGPFSAIFLDDTDLHPRVRARIELTDWLVEPSAHTTFRVETRGRNAGRARVLARPARRPRVALRRGAAGDRPQRRSASSSASRNSWPVARSPPAPAGAPSKGQPCSAGPFVGRVEV